jgi:hypothetical protein
MACGISMKPVLVGDLETDPFEYGKFVEPFASGFYDGSTFTSFWSRDCCDRLVELIHALPEPSIIYFHNGGRFDFFYLLKHLAATLRIVNNRIIQAWIGPHELRDSYAIMPFALEKYQKTKIDYKKFRTSERDMHRQEITSYLRDDCVSLHTLCVAFVSEFGDALTIGGASMKELKKFHTFDSGNGVYDEKLRSRFYYGGRNQVFRAGMIDGPIKIIDINSSYPTSMRDFLHPVSTGIYQGKTINEKTCFLSVEGRNLGAFPSRMDNGGLNFTRESGIFHPSIHEFHAALETGTFEPTRILETFGWSRRESFAEFVTHFYDARNKASSEGDEIRKLFYKFVLNSGYGKFAQNPDNYADWYITKSGELPQPWHDCGKSCAEPCASRWTPTHISVSEHIIWSKPLARQTHYNVATGASITGASRALLLRGLAQVVDPYYCDTDSIICRDTGSLPLHDSDLGSWKLETVGTHAAVCGKKLYAIWDDAFIGPLEVGEPAYCVKKAHKGARLSSAEILSIASGATVESANPVPAFKLGNKGTHLNSEYGITYSFTKRKIRSTAA